MSLPSEDTLEIYQLYARYAHTFDSRDAEGWAACFTSDGLFHGLDGIDYVGIPALTAFARKAFANNVEAGIKTRHWMANHLLEAEAGGAQGSVHVMLLGIKPELPIRILSSGVYHDRLAKTPEGWRIRSRRSFPDRERRGFDLELSSLAGAESGGAR